MTDIKLRPAVVYRLTYDCTAHGLPDEQGTIIGFWTGEIDTWGKLTIQTADRHVYYLFADEIVGAKEVES